MAVKAQEIYDAITPGVKVFAYLTASASNYARERVQVTGVHMYAYEQRVTVRVFDSVGEFDHRTTIPLSWIDRLDVVPVERAPQSWTDLLS